MRATPRLAYASLLSVLAACGLMGRAGEPPAQDAAPGAKFTTLIDGGSRKTLLLAPGEWVPHTCWYAMPYRGGAVLRFDYKDGNHRLSIDGGPVKPAWIEYLDRLKRELDRGARGFAVICTYSDLNKLPPLPRGRDIALTVHDWECADLAPLASQPGITGFSVASGVTDLGPLAALPDLTSLQLDLPELTDLRPLSRLSKVTWVRFGVFSTLKLKDLSPLAEMPSLQGLRLMNCLEVTDLSPLTRARNLKTLKIEGCSGLTDFTPLAQMRQLTVLHIAGADLTDLAPLAGLTRLKWISLDGMEQVADLKPLENLVHLERVDLPEDTAVTDLTPLRHLLRRGGAVEPPARLLPQIDRLRAAKDF